MTRGEHLLEILETVELTTEHALGFTLHLEDEVLVYDREHETPWRRMSYPDWEHYMEMVDAYRELGN